MHDIKLIRENPKLLDNGLERRNMPSVARDILSVDSEKRNAQTMLQQLQEKQNHRSKQFGEYKREGKNTDFLSQEIEVIKQQMIDYKETERIKAGVLDDWLSVLPNIPADDVPYGKDEKNNLEIRKNGAPRRINSAKEHYDIGEKLGLMDFENAAKLSGARFTILKGPLAQLERALGNFMLPGKRP